VNQIVEGYEVDFSWPPARLVGQLGRLLAFDAAS
jgi:hypothetical protein